MLGCRCKRKTSAYPRRLVLINASEMPLKILDVCSINTDRPLTLISVRSHVSQTWRLNKEKKKGSVFCCFHYNNIGLAWNRVHPARARETSVCLIIHFDGINIGLSGGERTQGAGASSSDNNTGEHREDSPRDLRRRTDRQSEGPPRNMRAEMRESPRVERCLSLTYIHVLSARR